MPRAIFGWNRLQQSCNYLCTVQGMLNSNSYWALIVTTLISILCWSVYHVYCIMYTIFSCKCEKATHKCVGELACTQMGYSLCTNTEHAGLLASMITLHVHTLHCGNLTPCSSTHTNIHRGSGWREGGRRRVNWLWIHLRADHSRPQLLWLCESICWCACLQYVVHCR